MISRKKDDPRAMFAFGRRQCRLSDRRGGYRLVLLVRNEKGADAVMSSKVKLGADASPAAGPVGRTTSAETDVDMKAEILSWSRARGVFAGVSLEGSTLRSHDGANKDVYGEKLSAKEIVPEGEVQTTESGKPRIELLEKTSPKHAT